jgi:hypothetical protein
MMNFQIVLPANAGVPGRSENCQTAYRLPEIPAFAGMTA